MFPTDAKLENRAREIMVRLAKRHGLELRQSYARVDKLALIKHQRYAHAHQFKRANKALRKLRTYLGRVIRDVGRRIEGNDVLQEVFAKPMSLARRVRDQDRHQRGPKVYSLHAPEVECIGNGKAHRSYGFGVKVVTTLKRSSGGQFVAARHRHSGHGANDRQHHRAGPHRCRISRPQCAAQSQVQDLHRRPEACVTPQIKREFKRRAAVEPVIGHLKAEHRMGCNHLRTAPATPSTPCSPQSATTSTSCSGG